MMTLTAPKRGKARTAGLPAASSAAACEGSMGAALISQGGSEPKGQPHVYRHPSHVMEEMHVDSRPITSNNNNTSGSNDNKNYRKKISIMLNLVFSVSAVVTTTTTAIMILYYNKYS